MVGVGNLDVIKSGSKVSSTRIDVLNCETVDRQNVPFSYPSSSVMYEVGQEIYYFGLICNLKCLLLFRWAKERTSGHKS